MGEKFRKRFVILFCTLLLLQETHGFLKIQQGEEKRERRNVDAGDGLAETKSISAVNLRKQRGGISRFSVYFQLKSLDFQIFVSLYLFFYYTKDTKVFLPFLNA